MTSGDDRVPEHEGEDILAAEYVLGVLPAGEREAVARRVENDPAFARHVEAWEERLWPLAGFYETAEPPAGLKAAIDHRLFGAASADAPGHGPGLLQSLFFWRFLAGAAFAALLLVAVPQFLSPTPEPDPGERLVASMSAEDGSVGYLAVYDAGHGELALSHVAGERGAGHDFELWVIEGDNPPVSLGVIPAAAHSRHEVPHDRRNAIASGGVFAISLEPEGGSPTGQPTGPVVASGELRLI